jgi:acetolactate synthase I/II/III large subunit
MSSSASPRTGGQLIVDALKGHGVDMAFAVPGESYLAVLDALYDASNAIKLVTCRHEAGAANMAEAYGKLTGKPGIVMVTRGPGACHASIGLHNAFQDSTPLILLIGQVGRDHRDREAFQEVDYRRFFSQMTKWSAEIDSAARIPEYLHRAFTVATSGRPGPVALALPEDMLRESATVADAPAYHPVRAHAGARDMATLRALLGEAERPVLLVGGGGWTPEACRQITAFAGANTLPACCSFRRQDIFDNGHPSYVGHLNTDPDPKLLERLRAADLLLVVGARLGEISTQGYTLFEKAAAGQRLIHVHPDGGVLGRLYAPTLAIEAGMPEFAEAAMQLPPVEMPRWAGWAREAREDYIAFSAPAPYDGTLDLGACMLALRARLPADAILAVDAGNFSGWPMRFLPCRTPRTQLGPQSGAMGYGVPAAVAAALVHPERTVVGFIGDGGFLMAEQEIATAIQHGAAPILIVFNNGIYGTIRAHQERNYPGRVVGTDLKNPDFAALARSFGAHGETVERTADFLPAFERAVAARKLAVIDLRMDPEVISTRTTLTAIRDKALARRTPS